MKNNIENKFFGKRIVKEIFAKAKFAHKNLSALIAKAKQLGIVYAKEGYGSPSAGDSRWQKLHSELLAGGGGSQYSPENVQAEKEMLNAFMEANKKERSRLGFSRIGGKAKFAEQQWGSYEDRELSNYTKLSTVLMDKIETKLKELQDYRRELRSATSQLELAKSSGNTHLLEQLKSRIDRCDKARQSFSCIKFKKKFGKAEQVFKDGSVHLNFSEAQQWLSAASIDELKYIVKDAREAANAMGTEGNKWNYYHDLVLTAQDELGKRKSKMTRTGAKRKFYRCSDYVQKAKELGQKRGLQNILEPTEEDAEWVKLRKSLPYWNWDGFKVSRCEEDMEKAFKTAAQKAAKNIKMSRTGGKAKFETTKRYGLPELRKEKVLEMIKTGKYEAISDIKDGICYLRNKVNGKRVAIYVDG